MKRTMLGAAIFACGILVVANQNCTGSNSVTDATARLSLESNTIDVGQLGANTTCTGDTTEIINRALEKAGQVRGTVRIPAGCYLVSDALTLPPLTSGQSADFNRAVNIVGDGADSTIIMVSPKFNLSAKGVFVLTQNILYTRGAHLEGLSIVFSQPNTSDVTKLTHYPPAININGASHSEIVAVNVWDAWDGISALGTFNGTTYIPDTSGWKLKGVRMTAYNVGVNQDGSWDTIVIDDFHFHFNNHDWGQNPAQVNAKQSIFSDSAIALQTGHADDLKISDSILAGHLAINAEKGAISSGAYIEVSNSSFDFGTAVKWRNARQLQITNSNFQLADLSSGQLSPAIDATMGNIMVSNSYFNSSSARPSRPFISYIVSSGMAFYAFSLSVTGSTFNVHGANAGAAGAIALNIPSGTILNSTISQNTFFRSGAAAYSNALVSVVNSGYLNLIVQGNSFTQDAGASGQWISIDNDGPYNLGGNIVSPTLTSSYPSSRTIGIYQ